MSIPNPFDVASLRAAFPRLRVGELLGEGSFKVAYAARLGRRDLVLKLIKEPLDPPEDAETPGLPPRVERELRAMSRVRSPRVVHIVKGPGVKNIGGAAYVWYVEPLFDHILSARAPAIAPTAEAASLCSGLLEAVRDLWNQAHLVHRDIKPANIALTPIGPVLLDLGIALHTTRTPITAALAFGPMTFHYAAPEQFHLRRLAPIDFRTDLFLVGLVVFEFWTGVHPFGAPAAEDDEYLRRLFAGETEATALGRVEGGDQLKTVLARLLRPTPNQRYRSAELAIVAVGGGEA